MKLNKVMIINPVNYWYDTLRPPFGLLTIATKFIENNVEVIWIDADMLRNDKQVHLIVKQHFDADLIALGGMHTAYRYVKEFCQYLREEDINLPVLIGGRIASSIDHLIWTNIPNVNMLCKQEGEYVVDSLCKNLNNMSEILGIEYRQDGRIIKNQPAPIVQSMDEVPPLRWELLNHKYYEYPPHTGRLLTSRGCPFRCYFCRTADHKPDKYRPMGIEQVMQDVEYMVKNHNVCRVVFMDELFLQNKQRVDEFSNRIKEFNIQWQCSGRGDSARDDDLPLLKKMHSAGLDRIVIGVESGSPTMLKSMNKKLNLQRAERSIELIRKAGIRIGPTFVFGYPGETRETALESVRWRKKVRLPHRFFYATPYPGSELYNIWKEKFAVNPEEEEQYMLLGEGFKKITINFTDIPTWKLKLLALECVVKLNSLMWIVMYYIVFPLKIIHPKIPELATRLAVRMKRSLHNNSIEE